MYDSFILDNGQEVQTKRLNSIMDNYRIGETVPNYEGNYDGPTGNYFLIEEYEKVGILVINNIFIDYLFDDDIDNLKIITKDLFKTYLSNPGFLSLRLSSIIKDRLNPMLTTLEHKLFAVDRVLSEYKEYISNPKCAESDKFSIMFYEYIDRFKQGDSIDMIISEIMTDTPSNND